MGCHFLLQGSYWPRTRTCISCIGKQILYPSLRLSSNAIPSWSTPGQNVLLSVPFFFPSIFIYLSGFAMFRYSMQNLQLQKKKKNLQLQCVESSSLTRIEPSPLHWEHRVLATGLSVGDLISVPWPLFCFSSLLELVADSCDLEAFAS